MTAQMDDNGEETEIDETLPDVVKDFLRQGGELEEIRLDERGKWTHEGLDFENPKIIDLFTRNVSRTDGGTWVLEVGRFTYPIVVEETGFFVERVDFEEDPPRIHLSDHTIEQLDLSTIEYRAGGRLYCTVKEGSFRARFKRVAYQQMTERMTERDGDIYFETDGESVFIGHLSDMEEAEET